MAADATRANPNDDNLPGDIPEGSPLQRLTSGVSGAVILIALALVCYLSTLQFGYIWDDDAYVTQNNTLRTFGGLSRIWTEIGATPQYYPLTFTSFWIEMQITGGMPNPRLSHGINLALHAASVLVLWQLLRRLSVPGAWAAAALFAVHPINVESVAWIAERKNTLSLLLALAAAFFYLRYIGIIEKPIAEAPLEPEAKPKKKSDDPNAETEDEEAAGEGMQLSLPDVPWRLYTLFFIFFAMALLSKTVVAVLPIVLLLIVWWKRGKITGRDIATLVAPVVLGVGLGLITSHLEHSPDYVGAVGPEWQTSPVKRLMLAGQTTAFYLFKLVVPYPLMFNYPKWEVVPGNVVQWLPLLGVVAVTALVFALCNRVGRGLVVGWLTFLLCLAPVMGFVDFLPQRFSWVADHFAYMPSIAFLTMVAAGGAIMLQRLTRDEQKAETIGAIIAGIAIVGLAGLTLRHSFKFADSRTLWEATLDENKKSWIGAVNYAAILIEKGRSDLRDGIMLGEPERGIVERDKNFIPAERWLNYALKLNPNLYEAHFQLARLAMERRQHDVAIQHLLRSEQVAAQMQKGSFLQPQFTMGLIWLRQGKIDDAIAKFRELQTYEPTMAKRNPTNFADARMWMAEGLLRKLSKPPARLMESQADRDLLESIVEQFNQATLIAPVYIPPKLRLAQLLVKLEYYPEALEQLRDILALDRRNTEAKYYTADVAIKMDQWEVAGAQLIDLIRTDERYLPAYVRLAEVYEKVEQKDQAIAVLDRALKLNKDFKPALRLKAKLEGSATQPSTTQSTTDESNPLDGPTTSPSELDALQTQ